MPHVRIYGFVALLVFSFYGLGIYWTHTNQTALTLFTKEDGFLEWLTFLLFLCSGLFCFFKVYIQKPKGLAFWGTLALGAIFILGAGEEISWGQRLFEFQSPEFFSKHNNQSETNLHNLKVKGVKINKLVFGKILFLCILAHNIILPLIARKKKGLKDWMERIGGFFPPWPLVLIYFSAALLVDFVVHERHKELLETSGAIHYAASLFLTFGLGIGYSKPLIKETASKIIASMVFIVLCLFLTLNAWILSTALKL